MEPLLAIIAAAQAGVFSRGQALAAGYTDNRISRMLRCGAWVSRIHGVYRLAGTPTTITSRGWTVVLAAGPGALLSHNIAGRLHRIDGVPGYSRLDVSVPRQRRPRDVAGATLHRVVLDHADAARAGGLPVTSPTRTVVDLARVLDNGLGARVIADAVRTGLVSLERVAAAIDELRRCHGAGSARLALGLADSRFESILEVELITLVAALGFTPIPQFDVFERGRFLARVDLAIPELKLAIEADGYGTHALRPGFERDRERLALLSAAGWTLLAFTATQIRDRKPWVGEMIIRTASRLSAAAG